MGKKYSFYTGIGISLTLILTAALYWGSLDGPFLLDDSSNIAQTYIRSASVQDIIYVSTHNRSGLFGRPLSALSFAFSGLMHGPESWGYKYHNLLIHLTVGLLIFWFLLQILPALNNQLSERKNTLLAGVVASGWLLHPLMVSTVLYAVQRMAQLSALFTILALLLYVIARKIVADDYKKFLFLSYICFPLVLLCAVLSKENGALIPVYVLVLEFVVFQFIYQSDKERKRIAVFLCCFVALPVLLGSYYIVTHFSELAGYSGRNFNLKERLLTELHVVFFYLKLIILPQLSDMGLYHDDITIIRQFDIGTLLLVLFYLVCIAGVFIFRKTAPILAFGTAWFLISHLMESTFIDLELVFEHRNYLAIMGIMLIIFYYAISYSKKVFLLVTISYLSAFTVLAGIRANVWGNEELLYSVALIDHPNSVRAHNSWANIQYLKGNFEEAIEHLDKAFEINPDDAGATIHKIVLQCARDIPVNDLLVSAEDNLRRNPITPYALTAINNLIGFYDRGECTLITVNDILLLVKAASMQKETQKMFLHLGFLKRFEGQLHFLNGDYDQGVSLMLQAYETNGFVDSLVELVNIQLMVRKFPDAEDTINKIEEINEQLSGIEGTQLQELKQKLILAKSN